MKIADIGKKLKPYAPALSVVLVAGCIAGSLSSYQEPVYAAKEETGAEEDLEQGAKGSFDLEDGVYQGSGTGYAGTITVAVQIKDKQIVSIEILSSPDDAAFFNRAKSVIDKIIEGQTLEVDTVSGATYSSKGIISAVKNALTGEKDSGETGQSQAGNTAVEGSSTTVEEVQDAASYKDGTYYGTGTGFGGPLKVKVDISGGKIASIQIVETSDGSAYISKASSLIDAILSGQTTNVDTVSGATYSSVGIIQAVRAALSQAAVSGPESGQSGTENSGTDSEAVTGTVPYDEGIYYGTAEGYNGDVTVAVVIQEHTIKAILVTDHIDDESFFSRAMSVVTSVIKKQNTDVDTVSGATYSSNGLLNAIKKALQEAERITNGGQPEGNDTDISALTQLIASAQELVETEYTEATWAVLQTRLTDAQAALEADAQTEIDQAYERLKLAIESLQKKDGSQQQTQYIDGTYGVSVRCSPDEDEDFEPYQLSMSVTIRNDKIVAITNIAGDGDSSNDTYIRRAANGTSSRQGVVSQIVASGGIDQVDAVTRATCTSDAIVEGCKQAFEKAKRTETEG